jgi:hypothetical protein
LSGQRKAADARTTQQDVQRKQQDDLQRRAAADPLQAADRMVDASEPRG